MLTAYPRGLVVEEKDGRLVAYWRKYNRTMKLGKKNEQDEMLLVECEGGKEVNGERTVEELRADGYKDVCTVAPPSEEATCTYDEYDACFVQVWHEEEHIDEDELTAEEALQIITEGE